MLYADGEHPQTRNLIALLSSKRLVATKQQMELQTRMEQLRREQRRTASTNQAETTVEATESCVDNAWTPRGLEELHRTIDDLEALSENSSPSLLSIPVLQLRRPSEPDAEGEPSVASGNHQTGKVTGYLMDTSEKISPTVSGNISRLELNQRAQASESASFKANFRSQASPTSQHDHQDIFLSPSSRIRSESSSSHPSSNVSIRTAPAFVESSRARPRAFSANSGSCCQKMRT